MGKVQLVLVIHNHQPVGNFDAVMHEVTQRAYLPFLRVAARYPNVRFGLHTSGCLLEWMEDSATEYIELVRTLVQAGQVEVLGGGMYEPILPVLPLRDTLWQLGRMNEYVEWLFGAKPSGMWCPERVWEPHLPEAIARAGLNYTLLDDYHFRSAADRRKVESEYFRTAHAGHDINLLPISKKLRYTMPFKPVGDTIDFLRQLAEESEHTPLIVYGDDGEKFGSWPDTYDWVYERGWLEQFFTAISEAQDWVEVLLPSEAIAARQPSGYVYLPALSYAEMGEWTRLDPDAKPDDPPGHWRNFLRKYPESRQMLDRAIHISNSIAESKVGELTPEARDSTLVNLGKAECNCAYWHGVFGGIYLNYLRHALHHHAIKAETEIHKANHGDDVLVSPYPAGTEITSEYLFASAQLAAVADAGHGLCLTRLDDRATAFCWTNVLTRRREHYHAKLLQQQSAAVAEHASIHDRVVVKETGLEELLKYDEHQRVSFNVRGHSSFDTRQASPEAVIDQLRSSQILDDWDMPAGEVEVSRARLKGRTEISGIGLSKTIGLKQGTLALDFSVEAGQDQVELAAVSVEFNLSALTDAAPDRWLAVNGDRLALNEPILCKFPQQLSLCDAWQGRQLVISTGGANALVCYPVYTASSSEGGFERTYQGSCMLLLYELSGKSLEVKLRLALEELADGK